MITSSEFGPYYDSKYSWAITSLSDDQKLDFVYRVFSDPQHGRYTVFKDKYPDREKFAQIETRENQLVAGQEYLVVYSRVDDLLPDVEFAFTVTSDVGLANCGRLPTAMPDFGPGKEYQTIFEKEPVDAKITVGKTFKVFTDQGPAATKKFLDNEIDDYLAKGGTYARFQSEYWKEIQYRSGKDHPAWRAFGCEYIARKIWSYQAFEGSVQACSNGMESFLAMDRIGAAEEIFTPFRYMLKRREMSHLIDQYPVVDTPFPTLLEVKTRKIPSKSPKSISKIYRGGIAHGLEEEILNYDTASGFIDLAEIEYRKGNWKTALEWSLATTDFISRMKGHKKDGETDERYMRSINATTRYLMHLGFYDEAQKLARSIEEGKEAKELKGGRYNWRSLYFSQINALECRWALNQLELTPLTGKKKRPKDVEAAGFLHWRVTHLNSVGKGGGLTAKLAKVKVHLEVGSPEEKMNARRFLAELVAENNLPACLYHIELSLKEDKLDALESQLISLLKHYRETGRKIDEWKLYSYYSELLLKQGRLSESLTMQRESLRLIKAFDLFPFEPLERMKLARVLSVSGAKREAERETIRAKTLVSSTQRLGGPYLDRIKEAVLTFPIKIEGMKEPVEVPRSMAVSLQPTKAFVIPIEGKPGQSKCTLTNISGVPVKGSLAVSGAQVSLSYLEENAEIVATLGRSGKSRIDKLELDPRTFLLISIIQSKLDGVTGKVKITWKDSGNTSESQVVFEEKESGVNSAVINVGNYQLNDFYGVPIFHHYHQNQELPDPDFRVKTSLSARVEGYDADDQLLFVDENGNGSFLDPGDVINLDVNKSGFPDLPLINSEATFRLQVYPKGAPTKEGIQVTVEGRENGKWIALSVDHLSFPGSK